jgi:hypothetical protein
MGLIKHCFSPSDYSKFENDLMRIMYGFLKTNKVRTKIGLCKYIVEWQLPSGAWVTLDLNTIKILFDYAVARCIEFSSDPQPGYARYRSIYVKVVANIKELIAAVLQGDDAIFQCLRILGNTTSGAYLVQLKSEWKTERDVLDFCHHLFYFLTNEIVYDPLCQLIKIQGRDYPTGEQTLPYMVALRESVQYTFGDLHDPTSMGVTARMLAKSKGIHLDIALAIVEAVHAFANTEPWNLVRLLRHVDRADFNYEFFYISQ